MRRVCGDPYTSWQRGTNENGNSPLRYCFPKGADFATMADEELQDMIDEINNRPRKIPAYRTASEVLMQLAEQEARVAIYY